MLLHRFGLANGCRLLLSTRTKTLLTSAQDVFNLTKRRLLGSYPNSVAQLLRLSVSPRPRGIAL